MADPLLPERDHGAAEAPPGAAARPLTREAARAFALVTLLGAAMVVIGVFMPWGQDSKTEYYPLIGDNTGLPGDGVYALAIGVAVVCLGVACLVTTVPVIFGRIQAVGGVLVVAEAIYYLVGFPENRVRASAGLFVTLFGGIIIAVGAWPFLPRLASRTKKFILAAAVTVTGVSGAISVANSAAEQAGIAARKAIVRDAIAQTGVPIDPDRGDLLTVADWACRDMNTDGEEKALRNLGQAYQTNPQSSMAFLLVLRGQYC